MRRACTGDFNFACTAAEVKYEMPKKWKTLDVPMISQLVRSVECMYKHLNFAYSIEI